MTTRSLARITRADLSRLADIAADVEADLFSRHPSESGRYAGRLIGRALCQGAAIHYLDGANGVKDLDAWSFYADLPKPFPYRWHTARDYGPSKFGKYPGTRWEGRWVDLMGRSLPVPIGADPAEAIRAWLIARKTASARALASKAVILIDPPGRIGEVVWPLPK